MAAAFTHSTGELLGDSIAIFTVRSAPLSTPRLLVRRVIDELLQRGEAQIPARTFPGSDLLDWFKLAEVGAAVQVQLDSGTALPKHAASERRSRFTHRVPTPENCRAAWRINSNWVGKEDSSKWRLPHLRKRGCANWKLARQHRILSTSG